MKIRLFHKFIVAFIAIGVAAVTVAGLLIERELKRDLMIRIEEEMAAGARIIALMPAGEIVRHAGELAERTRARLTLIDAAGRVTADSELGDAETDDHRNRSEIQEARLRGVGKAVRYSHTLKQEMLYVAIPLREGPRTTGYVRLSRPLAEITRTIDGIGEAVFGILLGTMIAFLLIALLFSLKMLSPIGRLAAFTGKVRTGDVSGALWIESRDEIGQLSKNINEMVMALQDKIRTADEEKRKLESLFSGMSEGVMVLDAENRIESVNRGMAEMTGRPRGEVIGKT
ncbi:MAG: HAMP domain-containing protein, partial [Proteobacteria bacterium]|nr:HAMP domain-containing protein [Pseudomonadota bacterium]